MVYLIIKVLYILKFGCIVMMIQLNEFSGGLCKHISRIFNIRNRCISINKSLHILKNTFIKPLLLEVDFIDNKFCKKDMKRDDNIKDIVKRIKEIRLKLYSLNSSE